MSCSWDELWKKVTEAEDMDHIIAAHEVFLDAIIKGSLLNEESQVQLDLDTKSSTILLIFF